MTMRIPGHQIATLVSVVLPHERVIRFLESVGADGEIALVIESERPDRRPLRITLAERNLHALREALAMLESRRARRKTAP